MWSTSLWYSKILQWLDFFLICMWMNTLTGDKRIIGERTMQAIFSVSRECYTTNQRIVMGIFVSIVSMESVFWNEIGNSIDSITVVFILLFALYILYSKPLYWRISKFIYTKSRLPEIYEYFFHKEHNLF